MACLIQLYAPCIGWRRTDVADTHAALHWAQGVRRLVQEEYPQAQRSTLVMDTLNTHRRVTVYSMSTRNGTSPAGETGIGLHAQTWELVDYSGVRVQRRVKTLCQPASA